MRCTSEGKRILLADLQRCLQQRGWNISDLARFSGVHQSQVSRIISGDFKTFSSNVMQICMLLELSPGDYDRAGRDDRDDGDRKQIADSAIAIWDGTHQDAGTVVSLLREVAKLRKSGRRR